MKPRKLPSGNWNVTVMVQGVSKSFTGKTKGEVEALAKEWKQSCHSKPLSTGTLGDAIEAYISSRAEVLSPSTVRVYRKIQTLNFKNLQRRSIASLSDQDFQKEINAMTRDYSPKTIKNVWGFMSSVLRENGREVKVKLPQIVSESHPFLQPSQIKPFIEAIEGEKLEVPILLALHGLRRSEIMDLEWKDIDLDKGTIKVTGAAVMDTDGFWVHKKETKNVSSRREVPILIPRLKELLEQSEKKGYVVSCNPNSIYNATNRVCARLGYPAIGCHGLRHTFCSLCYHNGVSELACMKLGGWSDYGTMRKIYTHLADEDLQNAKENLRNFFE